MEQRFISNPGIAPSIGAAERIAPRSYKALRIVYG